MNTNPLLRRNVNCERAASLSRRHFLRASAPARVPASSPCVHSGDGRGNLGEKRRPCGWLSSIAERHHSRAWWPGGTRRQQLDLPAHAAAVGKSPAPVAAHFRSGRCERRPGADGAGDHARAGGTFLTGVRIKKHQARTSTRRSIDQVVARQIGHLTASVARTHLRSVRKAVICDSGLSALRVQHGLASPTPRFARAESASRFRAPVGVGSRRWNVG